MVLCPPVHSRCDFDIVMRRAYACILVTTVHNALSSGKTARRHRCCWVLKAELSLYRLCTLGYGVSPNPYKGEHRVPEKFRSGLFRWTSYQAQLRSRDASTTNTRPGGPPSLGRVHGSGTSSSRQTSLPWKTRQQRVLKLDTSRAYG